MSLPNPVIVVPGIIATTMRDEYPISPEVVWSVLTKKYLRTTLHPNDRRFELVEPARVRPGELFGVAYGELIEDLRADLESHQDSEIPVYPFSYDWRQPLEATELQLGRFVDEVIDRTKLIQHYHQDGFSARGQVNLVGHSMGGLVIAGMLQRQGAAAKVGKVVTIAAPFRGSAEAVIKIVTGLADLGTGKPRSSEREAARLTPALYHLLPSFERAVESADGVSTDLFSIGAWQKSVLRTLAAFIRRHGLEPAGADVQAPALLSEMLSEARRHRDRIESFALADAGLAENDWLMVVGVDSRTRIGLRVERVNGEPEFIVNSDLCVNYWSDRTRQPHERIDTGDGTVPYRGAMNSFVPLRKVVCVSPDDFGGWELKDRALTKLGGFHGILPNMNMLQRMIVRFFTGAPDTHNNTWGRRPPDLPSDRDWEPPLELQEGKR